MLVSFNLLFPFCWQPGEKAKKNETEVESEDSK